jgi:hypothetical protein
MTKKLKYPKIEYIESSDNLHYLSVIKFRDTDYLCIIDNITDETLTAYVLDNTQIVGINPSVIIHIATRWFYSNSTRHPISFEFSKRNCAARTSLILRSFNLYEVQQITGKPFVFNIYDRQKIRSRKIQQIPQTVEIKLSKK